MKYRYEVEIFPQSHIFFLWLDKWFYSSTLNSVMHLELSQGYLLCPPDYWFVLADGSGEQIMGISGNKCSLQDLDTPRISSFVMVFLC